MWVWKMVGPSLARPPPALAGNRIFRYSVCLCVCVCTAVCHGRPCRRTTTQFTFAAQPYQALIKQCVRDTTPPSAVRRNHNGGLSPPATKRQKKN